MKPKTILFLGMFMFAFAAVAQSNDAATVLTTQLPLWDDLAARWPWLSSLIKLIGVCRIAAKPVNATLRNSISDFVANYVPSIGGKADKVVRAVLDSLAYGLVRFSVDLVFSLKLPSLEEYVKQLALQGTPQAATAAPVAVQQAEAEQAVDATTNAIAAGLRDVVKMQPVPAAPVSEPGAAAAPQPAPVTLATLFAKKP